MSDEFHDPIPKERRDKIERLAKEVITFAGALEVHKKLVRYHRVAPPNISFVRVFRIKRIEENNVIAINAWDMAPPDDARYVSIGLDDQGERMVVIFSTVVNGKPQGPKAAIGYAENETIIAGKDVNKYLAKGIIPRATE